MLIYQIKEIGREIGWIRYIVDKIGQKLGELIADWRRRAGLTQERLAAAMGTQQTTVSKLEAGQYRMSVAQLLEILDICNLRLKDVAFEIEETVRDSTAPIWERIDE